MTGSSNLLTQRSIADALPGRAEYLRLWPFAQSELRGAGATLVDRLLADDPPRLSDQSPGLLAYADTIARGGFPDACHREDRRRHAYFQSYVDTLLGRRRSETACGRSRSAACGADAQTPETGLKTVGTLDRLSWRR